MKDPEIIDIDGKHYIELPCKPGDKLWMVHKYIKGEYKDGRFKSSWKVSPIVFHTVEDIIINLDEFGKTIFLTSKEAEIKERILNQ